MVRFTAKLNSLKHEDFQKLISCLEKIGSTAMLHLCPNDDSMLKVVLRADVNGTCEVWARLHTGFWFDDYDVESLNGGNVYLELKLADLSRALRSTVKAESVTLKLTKNGGKNSLQLSISKAPIRIKQQVPIELLGATAGAQVVEPSVERPMCLVFLPDIGSLHAVVDRLRVIDESLHVSTDTRGIVGELALRATNETAELSSFYENLRTVDIADASQASAAADAPSSRMEVAVDGKQFAKLLSCYQLAPRHAICGLLDNCLLLQLIAGGVDQYKRDELTLTAYAPTLMLN